MQTVYFLERYLPCSTGSIQHERTRKGIIQLVKLKGTVVPDSIVDWPESGMAGEAFVSIRIADGKRNSLILPPIFLF
jgi:hypothetical protein